MTKIHRPRLVVPGLPRVWRRLALVVLLTSLLPACTSLATRPPAAESLLWLEMAQPMVIPANSAHVDFQDGRPVDGFDRTRLYCSLEVDRVSDQPQMVPAQALAVRRVQRLILSDELANIPAFVVRTFSCSGDRYYRVRIDLEGELAPRVRTLNCTEWYLSCDHGEHATLQQVEQTLGPGFRWRRIEPGRWDDKRGDYQ